MPLLSYDGELTYPLRPELAEGDRLGFDAVGYPYAVAGVRQDETSGRWTVFLRRSTVDDLKRWSK